MAVDGYDTGDIWVRKDGGEIFGNIRFAQNSGPILTSSDGKNFILTVNSDGTLQVTETIIEEEETPDVAVLVPTLASRATWYNSDLAKMDPSLITSVTFDSNYEVTNNEEASWPCDDSGIGNIMAYRTGTEVTIKSTTGSSTIKLNPDSSYMFANDGTQASFASLSTISGSYTWVADNQTNFGSILRGNTIITNPITIPQGVTSINRAFEDCTSLVTPPELPEGVTSMNSAFVNCYEMQYLPNIPSTMTTMNYAFHVCKKAVVPPAIIPKSVTKMEATFRNCWNLNGTIEINAENISVYSACFQNTSRDSGAVTLTGASSLLSELAATNSQGKVTVAE